MRHLPRSLFSDNQMETILWCLSMLGLDNRPSLSTLKKVDVLLQEHCGIESIHYKGPLGHVYYANDLAMIITQVCTHFLGMHPKLDSHVGDSQSAHPQTPAVLP